MSYIAPALVFVPILGALVAVLLPRWGSYVVGVCSAAILAGTVSVTGTVLRDGPIETQLAGWAAPVGVGLRVDGLGAAMLLLTAVVGAAVGVYASGSEKARGNRHYWPLWLLLWAGLDAVYVAADMFNTYVALELVTVSAVGLVALGGRDSLAPALRYLFVGVMGSLAFLLAVGLLYAETGTLSFIDAGAGAGAGAGFALSTALCVAAIGLALKTALFPMHAWLPPAHAGAPSAVSPLMSALVIKASFYVLVRLWISVPAAAAGLALALAVLGCTAVLWGSIQALRQDKLKRVVAYSTVAQVGYFFLLFPLLTPGLGVDASPAAQESAALAFQGTFVLLLAHGLAKAAMFTAAGVLVTSHGTDELSALRGATERNPRAIIAFGVAGVSLAGLPPTLAFTGKWQMLTATVESGQWWWSVVLLGGGVLTMAYTVRVVAIALQSTEVSEEKETPDREHTWTPPPLRMDLVCLALVVSVVALGFQSSPLLELLDIAAVRGDVR